MTEPQPTGGRHRLRTTDTDPAEEPMSPDTAEATTWLAHPWPTEDTDQPGGTS